MFPSWQPEISCKLIGNADYVYINCTRKLTQPCSFSQWSAKAFEPLNLDDPTMFFFLYSCGAANFPPFPRVDERQVSRGAQASILSALLRRGKLRANTQ
jgi:hypothetical protein